MFNAAGGRDVLDGAPTIAEADQGWRRMEPVGVELRGQHEPRPSGLQGAGDHAAGGERRQLGRSSSRCAPRGSRRGSTESPVAVGQAEGDSAVRDIDRELRGLEPLTDVLAGLPVVLDQEDLHGRCTQAEGVPRAKIRAHRRAWVGAAEDRFLPRMPAEEKGRQGRENADRRRFQLQDRSASPRHNVR